MAGVTTKSVSQTTIEGSVILSPIQYLTGYSTRHSTKTVDTTNFPPNTHGFLYYHPPSKRPPIDEGHLRFRITENPDPASFAHGMDLLLPNGALWNIPAGRVASAKVLLAVRKILLDDGLVTEEQLDDWGQVYSRKIVTVRTFDPARLRASDYVDMSGATSCHVSTVVGGEVVDPSVMVNLGHGYAQPMPRVARIAMRFPSYTRGFLYYHQPAEWWPPLDEGHIRFRITNDDDPSSFAQGTDLLYPDGEPWYVPAGRIAVSERLAPFRDLLLADGLVDETRLSEWGSNYDERGRRRTILRELDTPFLLKVAQPFMSLRAIDHASGKAEFMVLRHPWTYRDCTGKAMCRFEDTGVKAKDGSPLVGLRLVKILEPLKYLRDGSQEGRVVCGALPKEGELIHRMLNRKQLWTIKAKGPVLHVLWERWNQRRA